MNIVDLCIAICLFFIGLQGWRRGLLRSLLGLAGFLASVWFALALGGWAGDRIQRWLDLSTVASAWTGAGLVLLVAGAVSFVIIAVLDRMIRSSPLKPINSVGGGVIGLLTGVLFLGLVISFLTLHPVHSSMQGRLSRSFLSQPVKRCSAVLVALIRRASPSVQDLLTRMKADERSVVHRSPEVADEVSKRVDQIWTEVDSLVGKGQGAPEAGKDEPAGQGNHVRNRK